MKRVVFYVIVFAVVVVSWCAFAQQRRAQTTAAPAQTTASIESPDDNIGRQMMEQCNKSGPAITG